MQSNTEMFLNSAAAGLAISLLSMPAAFAAATAGTHQNIEYARAGSTPLYLDASVPEGSGPFSAAIIVHGGGWVRGDRRIDVNPLFDPLTSAGIAWFSIDYRLSSDITLFGGAVEDVRAAIRYVKAHAAEYGVDTERIALIGESAGGQLAAMAALDSVEDTRVKAVVALYAPMDLVDLAKNSQFVPKQMRDSLQGTPFEKLLLARLGQLSPIENVKADAPPFLLIHGTADSLVPFAQSKAMCERMKSAGASCELFPLPGGGHGMRWWESSHPHEAAAYKREMLRWLREKLIA